MCTWMLASDLDVLAWAHPPRGWGHEQVCGRPRYSGPQRGTSHTPRQHPMGLGCGREYLACWLETELVIDIKREVALLRQMLPDARITGSMLLPRWVWVGARKVTAVDKIRKVVNHKVASWGRFLEGWAYSRMASQCKGYVRTSENQGMPLSLQWQSVQAWSAVMFVCCCQQETAPS